MASYRWFVPANPTVRRIPLYCWLAGEHWPTCTEKSNWRWWCGYVECCMWLRGEFCKRVKLLNRPPPTTAFIIGVGNFSTDTIYAVRLFWLLPRRFSPIFAFYSAQFHFYSYYLVELSGYFLAHFYSAHCITITIFFPPRSRVRLRIRHLTLIAINLNTFSTWFCLSIYFHHHSRTYNTTHDL